MKRILVGVMGIAMMIGAVSCGGVDKQGTADNLVKNVEKAAGVTLTATQKSCLTTLVKSYSDDDLKKIDKGTDTTDPVIVDFGTRAATCLADLVTPDTTGADSTDAGTTPGT